MVELASTKAPNCTNANVHLVSPETIAKSKSKTARGIRVLMVAPVPMIHLATVTDANALQDGRDTIVKKRR